MKAPTRRELMRWRFMSSLNAWGRIVGRSSCKLPGRSVLEDSAVARASQFEPSRTTTKWCRNHQQGVHAVTEWGCLNALYTAFASKRDIGMIEAERTTNGGNTNSGSIVLRKIGPRFAGSILLVLALDKYASALKREMITDLQQASNACIYL